MYSFTFSVILFFTATLLFRAFTPVSAASLPNIEPITRKETQRIGKSINLFAMTWNQNIHGNQSLFNRSPSPNPICIG